ALILLYTVKGAPIDLLSHIMMSAHMIQMCILYFVIPIFFIRGLPTWMIEKMIHQPIVKPLSRFFTDPLIPLGIFTMRFAMYHLPHIFDFSHSHFGFDCGITIVLFVFSIFMWWSIVTPLKAYKRLNPLIQMGYLLGSILIISIACALMIFAT